MKCDLSPELKLELKTLTDELRGAVAVVFENAPANAQAVKRPLRSHGNRGREQNTQTEESPILVLIRN